MIGWNKPTEFNMTPSEKESYDRIEQLLSKEPSTVPAPYHHIADELKFPADRIEPAPDVMDMINIANEQAVKKYIHNVEQKLFSATFPGEKIGIAPITAAEIKMGELESGLHKPDLPLTASEHITEALKKMGRAASGRQMTMIKGYLHRNSFSVFKEEPATMKDDEAIERSIDTLMDKLAAIPAVKPKLLFDQYPDSVGLLIRVDYAALDEAEMQTVPERINTTLQTFKPEGLRELEVTYHNQEVY